MEEVKTAFEEESNDHDQGPFKFHQFVSTVFGLSIPNLFNYNGLSVLYILYVILLIAALVMSYVLTILWKSTTNYCADKTCVIIHLVVVSSVICNLASIVSTVFLHRRKLVVAVAELAVMNLVFDTNFASLIKHKKGGFSCWIVMSMVALHICVCIITAYAFFTCITSNSFECLKHNPTKTVNFYMILITATNISYFAFVIHCHYKRLNYKLSYLVKATLKARKENKSVGTNTQFFMKTHDRLCDITDLLSNIFGIQLLWINIVTILQCLYTLNMLKMFYFQQGHEDLQDVFINVAWSILLVVSKLVYPKC